MAKIMNLVGQRFGALEVIARAGTDHRNSMWMVGCDCDGASIVSTADLRSGHTKSCGCAIYNSRPRHGHSRTGRVPASPTYQSWSAMMRRCTTPGAANYALYGGRGISVCDRWMSFENFLSDMGERPPGTSLDRIDGQSGYRQDNCRWSGSKQQNRNRINVRLTTETARAALESIRDGERQSDVARRLGVSPATICDLVHGRTWPELTEK